MARRTPTPAAQAAPTPDAAASEPAPLRVQPPGSAAFPGTGALVRTAPPAPSAPVVETAQGEITFNFVNADVREVAREMLGDTLHLNYVVDPKAQATITMQTGRPVARAAVLPTLESVLQANGLALVPAGDVYRILPIEDAPHAGAGSVRRFGVLQAGYGIQVLPLKFVSAAELQRVLLPFVPAGGVLQTDAARNLLLVSGARADLEGFAQLVEQFDVDWLGGMSFGLFALHVATAKSVAADLEQVFGDAAQGPLAGVVRIAPIDRLNAVLVVTPQPAYLREVKSWVDRLDYANDETTPRMFEYRVQNSRAADLAAVLNELLATGNVRTVGPTTAPGTTLTTLSRSASQGGGAAPPPQPPPGAAPPPPAFQSGGGALSGPGSFGTGSFGQAQPPLPPGPATGQPPGGAYPRPEQSPGFAAGLGLGPERSSAQLELPQVRVVADEKNNALVIFARPRDYRMIEGVIKRLDIVPLQVLIEATIAEITLTDALQYGVQYFLKTFNSGDLILSNLGSGAVQSVFPGFNYVINGLTGSNAQLILSALRTVSDVNVISSPQILVLDHQTAFIQVGNQVPIPIQQAQSVINPEAPIINSIQYRDTGVILQVAPRVNASGQITLEISQEVSDVTPTTSSQLNAPTFNQRRIVSNVIVQNGETVALGGLIRDSQNDNKSGIPLLSDIPYLGALFGTTSRSAARTELLVLLSPRVVRNPDEARKLTDELRDRMRALVPLEPRIR